MDNLFVVVYRGRETNPWQSSGKPLTEERLAVNAVEIGRDSEPTLTWAYIKGVLVIPETPVEADKRLGDF